MTMDIAAAIASPVRRTLALRLLPLLDLTRLGDFDTPEQIETLCATARTPWGMPAAVCVNPELVTTARRALAGSSVKVATVVNFPDGGCDHERARRETRRALAAGADEIDLVLPWRALLRDDVAAVTRVVNTCRMDCGGAAVLKLILETGKLATPERIRQAADIGMAAEVDFLKTATGKVEVNATPEAAALMLDAIADGGGRCGFKAAGGIRTLADAAVYLRLAEERLGADWVTPGRFRIGASGLFDEILAVLQESPAPP